MADTLFQRTNALEKSGQVYVRQPHRHLGATETAFSSLSSISRSMSNLGTGPSLHGTLRGALLRRQSDEKPPWPDSLQRTLVSHRFPESALMRFKLKLLQHTAGAVKIERRVLCCPDGQTDEHDTDLSTLHVLVIPDLIATCNRLLCRRT